MGRQSNCLRKAIDRRQDYWGQKGVLKASKWIGKKRNGYCRPNGAAKGGAWEQRDKKNREVEGGGGEGVRWMSKGHCPPTLSKKESDVDLQKKQGQVSGYLKSKARGKPEKGKVLQ